MRDRRASLSATSRLLARCPGDEAQEHIRRAWLRSAWADVPGDARVRGHYSGPGLSGRVGRESRLGLLGSGHPCSMFERSPVWRLHVGATAAGVAHDAVGSYAVHELSRRCAGSDSRRTASRRQHRRDQLRWLVLAHPAARDPCVADPWRRRVLGSGTPASLARSPGCSHPWRGAQARRNLKVALFCRSGRGRLGRPGSRLRLRWHLWA
jgi:hypothetical protein